MIARLLGTFALAFGIVAGAHAHGVHQTPAPPSTDGTATQFRLWPQAVAAMRVRIDERDGFRVFEADGLPDHATGQFPNRGNPNRIQPQTYRLRVPLAPAKAAQVTPLPRGPFGIALNGVLFDPGTAEFWNNNPRAGWNYEALSGRIDLGLDRNNAHVQPSGAYHYHGLPTALLERAAASPGRPVLLGYAADGFPIYGPHGHRPPAEETRQPDGLRPSWRLRAGTRPGGPGGRFDGTYVEDYEYVAGSGDLDSCNGREGPTAEYPAGTYYYVVTRTFPFVPRCFTGTPEASFRQRPPHERGGPGGPPPGGGPPPPRPGGPFGPPPGR